jgi:hypothetical protein
MALLELLRKAELEQDIEPSGWPGSIGSPT